MRQFTTAIAVAALMHSMPATAKDDAPISLAKTTKWEMNYDDDSCHLLARFGEGDDNVIFVLTREQPGDLFDLQLYGKTLNFSGISVPILMTFGVSGQPGQHRGIALTMGGAEKLPVIRISGLRIDGGDDRMNYANAPKLTPTSEAKVTVITFKKPGGRSYRLETGDMSAPLAAMRACTTDLVKSWGYDPTTLNGLSRHVTPTQSPGKWLSTNDFPDKSWTQGHNGLVRFRLDVDAAGQPTGCRILYRTNPDEFADLSCKLLMQRARFVPALDAAGKPTKAYYINTIRWIAGGEW